MSTAHPVTLIGNEPCGTSSRRLTLQPQQPLSFQGGQFIILDTGHRAGDGDRPLKRAWSIASADGIVETFELIVQSLGPGSRHIAETRTGTTLSFSGPWGKCLWRPEDGTTARIIVTDTGITAAAGLCLAKEAAKRQIHLTWLCPDPRDLVDDQFFSQLPELEHIQTPPVNTDQRKKFFNNYVSCFDSTPNDPLFVIGDGHLISQFSERPEFSEHLRREIFFNKPAKSAN